MPLEKPQTEQDPELEPLQHDLDTPEMAEIEDKPIETVKIDNQDGETVVSAGHAISAAGPKEEAQPEVTLGTMRAIIQTKYGGPEVLHFAGLPKSKPGAEDLLVRVKAISVNPVDTKVRRGGPPGTPLPDGPKILGWDAAGIVEAVGEQVSRFVPGEAVYFAGDITRPGSYAEYVTVDRHIVGHKPATLSFEQAAALPLTALTAWEALLETMQARREVWEAQKTLLIMAGAGGVGSIAIQIAKQVCDLRVVATASRLESSEFCRQMGADAVINHHKDLAPQLKKLGIQGADFILNCAPLSNFSQLVSILNPLGEICSIVGGAEATALDLSPLMPIRGKFSFELMFTRPRLKVDPEKQGHILDQVAELVDEGKFVSTVTQTLSWTSIQEAHRIIEAGHTIGKIVLTVDDAEAA